MKKITLAATASIIWVVLLGLSHCAPHSQTRVHHVILVWFPEGTPQAQINLIKEETDKLSKIDGILSVTTGEALESERPMVDDSFDFGVVMEFASVEAMNRYLGDAAHREFLERYIKGKTQKILIYDIHSSR